MNILKKGFTYYVLATIFTSLILMSYIKDDVIVPMLDLSGWLFFITSCISHAAILLLALWLIFFLPLALLKKERWAVGLFIGAVSVLATMAFINMQVYKIYRFHINGFIINMITGPNAGDIFDFSPYLYLTEGISLLVVIGICIGLWPAAKWLSSRIRKRGVTILISSLVGITLIANGIHVYGSFVAKPSILQSVRLVPYYFPLSASSLMQSLGVKREVVEVSGMSGEGEMCYPLHPLQKADSSQLELPNIVVILIDSWSRQSLTPECMPNMWQLAHEEQWYKNHVSCGNGTSFSVFGMFTGIQPYYWTAYQSARLSPLLVDRLLELGYDFRVYPSAGLQSPPFDRLLFQHVPNLRLDTPLPTSYERDLKIKDDFIADMPQLKAQKRPFFTFIFFDLLHAYSLPKELLNRFQPSWEYGRFDELNNDMDPTPFWNLYRNSAYQTDKMVHEVIANLKEQGLYDNSLVFITGDHAQEYNENHKNYWGHNSNFSQYQIGVPLIVHQPDHDTTAVYTHRTTHYDFVPTIMHNYLGIKNPLEDYTAGRLLSDKTPRLWHFVGNELRYAFIVEGDTILTKEGAGYIEVTDSKLNPVDNYRIRPKEFDKAIKDLNRFFNQ
ncbi:sulfatase-like hydrolase/transferase [Prevotella sp. E15-22]|uniref:sulfatase-like hydrolase/transferase n=1 Tax=Prevotella sp. E15-22 TaxID=2937774 RepID=UPI00205176F0|nr:sulfatase-like hydrolase/transferase [Prevotella sp. E15-22]UPS44773.1 sulfatase-like hydrolase/transferase [Prevotella sp. E15-22]